MGNSLAACVNTVGGTSNQCAQLFHCAAPGAAVVTGVTACTAPTGATLTTDTLAATLAIARNPGLVSVAGIFSASTRNVVFSPGLTAAPTDWTLTLAFGIPGGELSNRLAIDAGGNVWIPGSTSNNVVVLGPTGVPIAGSPFTAGGLNAPNSIAIDAAGNAWITNFGNRSITELAANGSAAPGSPFTPVGIAGPNDVAIDPAGNVWVVDVTTFRVSELTPNGVPVGGNSFATGGGYHTLAIDPSGNIWLAGDSANVQELSPAAVVLTTFAQTQPLAIAIDPAGNIWTTNTSANTVSDRTRPDSH